MRNGVVLGVLAIGLLIGGCGDSGSKEDSSVSRTMSDAVAREADSVCVVANKSSGGEILKAYNRKELKGSYFEGEAIGLEEKVLIPILIANARAVVEGLNAINAQGSDQRQLDDVLAAYRGWIKEAEATPHGVVVAGDTFNQARNLAAQFGVARCEETPYDVNSSWMKTVASKSLEGGTSE